MMMLVMDLLMMILGKMMMITTLVMVMVTCGRSEVPLVDQMNLKCFTACAATIRCATRQYWLQYSALQNYEIVYRSKTHIWVL